ncbi:MAG: carbohydrate kinase family protein [Capsulimonadales bacterium]|nr:carbohydrate kinase family protein [Capsulimonadales bacterium]
MAFRPNIVGLGLINRDIVAVVPEWERDAKVAATHFFEQVGGPVPVAMVALARLGNAPVFFLGVTGEDRDGEELAETLREEKVTPLLRRASGIRTSRSLVLLDARDGSRTLANYAEDLPPRSLTDPERELLRQPCLLHLDGRDLPVSIEAAEIVRQSGGIVSLDLGTMRPGREALLDRCHIVIASKKGGRGAFSEISDDPAGQVRAFHARGIEVAGVTLGAEGVVLGRRGENVAFLPACAVERVADTCGAGDLFHGAFLHAYLAGATVREAADFAQAAVAVRITRIGNAAGLPNRAEVTEFQRRLRG